MIEKITFRNVKNLLFQLVVNGSIITKLSLQVFMAAYEYINW